MRLSTARALEIFADAYGPGLDEDRAAAGLEAVATAAAEPACENEIRKRKLAIPAKPFFARYEAATGVTRAELTAPSTEGRGHPDPLTPHRDAFIAMLIESTAPKFSIGKIALIVGRDRVAVRRAYARYVARVAAAKRLPSLIPEKERAR